VTTVVDYGDLLVSKAFLCFLLEGRKFLDVFQDMEGMNSWLNESDLGGGT
jgi:hypothetical protein